MNDRHPTPFDKDRSRRRPVRSHTSLPYVAPRLSCFGALHQVIRGASLKGVDSSGELDLENLYPR